jgi:hypothetical protein
LGIGNSFNERPWRNGKSNERSDDDVMIPSTKLDAVRRMEEDLYA